MMSLGNIYSMNEIIWLHFEKFEIEEHNILNLKGELSFWNNIILSKWSLKLKHEHLIEEPPRCVERFEINYV